jgi:hypothetical protein
MYDLCRSGNYAEAMTWQYRILELFDATLYSFGFPHGFRAAAELRGFHFGVCILADFELVNPPAAGCAPRSGQITGDKVIETQGFTAVFEAIDTALKTAAVEVLAREKLGGGYITVLIKGDVAAVQALSRQVRPRWMASAA